MNPNVVFSALLFGVILVSLLPNALAEPMLYDDNLILEKYTSEFGWGYTTITFVGNDMLVLEKEGFVSLIRDGSIQDEPILEILVDQTGESGLLGITSVDSTVYLYFTEADQDGNTLGNRIYKYDWNGNDLVNPILIKELPSNDYHNSGVLVTGLDNQVYAVIGDAGIYGPLQNKSPGDIFPPDTQEYMDTSVVLRVEPEGPYYAMGIRNSFGLAVDPVTGKLWETENGDDDFDEINLISDKHNGGWERIMGPATQSELDALPGYEDYIYHDPEFSWEKVVAPTGLGFAEFKETKNYDRSLFVGDCNIGNLYKFELNQSRDGLEFSSPGLQDKVANKNDSQDEIIIGSGFKCISDIETGPDGFLYIASFGERTIYRILPVEAQDPEEQSNPGDSMLPEGGGCLIATATFGSELTPQVQQLRELRDEKIMQTELGSSFLNSFNGFYYSFSPTIADYERENPLFKETIRIAITPIIYSLSILNHVDIDSEAEVLGYGMSIMTINIGMYFVAPAAIIIAIKKKF